MRGQEVKDILINSGYVLKDVATAMGIIPQTLQSLLSVDDIKTGVLERIAMAISKSVYFFYTKQNERDGDMLLRQLSEQGEQSNDQNDFKEKYLRLLEQYTELQDKHAALQDKYAARLEQHTELQDKYAARLEEREKKDYATRRVGAAGVAAAGG